jgi:hypothetical protein
MAMNKFFPFTLLCLLVAPGCVASPPPDDAEFRVAATEYSAEIAKARYIQRKCPSLIMSFDGMMEELRSRPILASANGKMTEDMVDKSQVLAAVDRFEAENGLKGASQQVICDFGDSQIGAATRTGKLLAKRTK